MSPEILTFLGVLVTATFSLAGIVYGRKVSTSVGVSNGKGSMVEMAERLEESVERLEGLTLDNQREIKTSRHTMVLAHDAMDIRMGAMENYISAIRMKMETEATLGADTQE